MRRLKTEIINSYPAKIQYGGKTVDSFNRIKVNAYLVEYKGKIRQLNAENKKKLIKKINQPEYW